MGYKYLYITYSWLYYCPLMGVQVSVHYLYIAVLLSPDGGTSICVVLIHGCTTVP